MSVLVAGNGSLLDRAGETFAAASRLVVATDDARALDWCARLGTADVRRESRYLGVLGNRGTLGGVFDACDPDIVFADLTAGGATVANPLEAYCRAVLVPLERLAAESAGRGVRYVAVLRETDLREAADAAEAVVRSAFRGDPSRCAVVRIDREPRGAQWSAVVEGIVEAGSGVHRVVRDETSGAALLRPVSRGPAPDVREPYRELVRRLDEGDPAFERTLAEIARAVREHVS